MKKKIAENRMTVIVRRSIVAMIDETPLRRRRKRRAPEVTERAASFGALDRYIGPRFGQDVVRV